VLQGSKEARRDVFLAIGRKCDGAIPGPGSEVIGRGVSGFCSCASSVLPSTLGDLDPTTLALFHYFHNFSLLFYHWTLNMELSELLCLLAQKANLQIWQRLSSSSSAYVSNGSF
jgi:hypothetical protein